MYTPLKKRKKIIKNQYFWTVRITYLCEKNELVDLDSYESNIVDMETTPGTIIYT